MATGKTIALTIWTFVSKVICLLFNALSNASFQGANIFFNFKAAVPICSDFGTQEKKLCHHLNVFPFYLHGVMGSEAMTLVF